ncbi:Exocyst complex component EXO70A1, partial [Dichanthelium oligosanthes]
LRGPHESLESFLEAVDLLKGVLHFFSSNRNFKSSEEVLNQVNNLLTKSALKIEEEFRQLMGTYSKPIEPDRLFDCLPKPLLASKGDPEAVGEQPSKSFETVIYRTPTLIPPGILPLLHDIARQLVQDGNQQSCYRIYRYARGSALQLSLQKLGIEKLSKDVQRMEWVALKMNIGTWTQVMQITIKVLLAGERKICDQIFDGISFNKDQYFAELAGSSVMTLLSFGDTVARSKRSDESLFVLLEMYSVMHELQPEVEVISQGKLCSEIQDAALNLTKSLAQAAQEALVDFEEAVEKDSSKTIMQNGTVHPFTIEVNNCVKSLFESHAEDILGGDWIQRHRKIVQQNANQYKRVTWARILQTLTIQGTGCTGSSSPSDVSSSGVSRNMIKERFKSFNMQFEELHAKQSQWTIPDQELRDNLRLAVAEVLLPAYRSFINLFGYVMLVFLANAIILFCNMTVLLFLTFRSLIQRGKNPHKYIKHSPEALDQLLSQFFKGQQVGEQKH